MIGIADYLFKMSDTELKAHYLKHRAAADKIEAKRGRIAATHENNMAGDARFVLRGRGYSLDEIKTWRYTED